MRPICQHQPTQVSNWNMSASAINTSWQLKYICQHQPTWVSNWMNHHIYFQILSPLGTMGLNNDLFKRCNSVGFSTGATKRGFGILGQQNSHFLTFLASRKYETHKHRLNDQSDHNWWQPLWLKFYTSWTPSHRLVQIVEKIFELHLISRWWAPAPPHSLASQLLTHWPASPHWLASQLKLKPLDRLSASLPAPSALRSKFSLRVFNWSGN